jgi:hypothetical protein
MGQDLTDILPHQLVKRFNWDRAGRTLLIVAGNDGLILPMTDRVGIATAATAANAPQAAQTTTDQGP